MDHNKKFIYNCIVVPITVTNNIISSISGVIIASFFQPMWHKFMKWGNSEK